MASDQLLTEIADGDGEKLTILAKRIPSYRNGKPATLSRLVRWILNGKAGPTGEKVYLEAVKSPGGWVSTPQAVARFFAALTPQPNQPNPATKDKPRSAKKRQSASDEAGKKLSKLGI